MHNNLKPKKIMCVTSTDVMKINNKYYCSNATLPTLNRYIQNFGEIYIIGRVYDKKGKKCEGFVELPKEVEVLGESSYAKMLKRNFLNIIKNTLKNTKFLFIHFPSIPGYIVAHYAKKMNINYCSVVVGCTWDSFFNYSFLGKLLAPFSFLIMKKYIRKSKYAIYVTKEFLQHRYPCHCNSINASNVYITELNNEVLLKRYKKIESYSKNHTFSLATCAAVDVKFKGQEDVIKAISKLKRKGKKFNYYLAGGGDQNYLKKISRKYNVEKQVFFLGNLNSEQINELLDKIDIYIQPSKQEGLPRAVIEAMNRACPVLGANTGGIPELIDKKFVFKKGKVNDIVAKIEYILNENMKDIAKRNFEESSKYLSSIIDKRRNNYYNKIKIEEHL